LESELAPRIDHFNTRIAPSVEGWLGDRIYQVVKAIGPIFEQLQITGDIAEIGVHHGLSFFLLMTLRSNGERCVAIDLFDSQQQLNIDRSGMGSLPAFVSHLEALLPTEVPHVTIVQRDSLSFSFREFGQLFASRGVKFFSVDGGHTVLHVVNDLSLVQEVLVPGGMVALDDFLGPHWPTVTEGFYRFMETRNRRMSPLLYFQNKLFLTTISEHDTWLEKLRIGLEAVVGEEFRSGHWRTVEIAGATCLSHAR
jgi:Methyltransferase domain